MAHTLSNRVSFQISPEGFAKVMAAVKVFQEELVPLLVPLSPDERKRLPKMGAKSVDFVSKSLSYTRSNAQIQPSYVDTDEFSIDLAAVGILREVLQPMEQVTDMVRDTLLLSGSEAMAAALACYEAFKSAAKANVPGAATIVADLAERFAAGRSKSDGGAPSDDAPPANTDPAR